MHVKRVNGGRNLKSGGGQTSPRFLIVVLLLALLPALGLLAATGPAWWTERGVLNTNPANDYAAINQGQLKNIAVQAYAELHAKLPASVWTNGAGATLTASISAFQANTNSPYNYSAVNLGQLKAVAKPFYDVLNSAGYTNSAVASPYPWSNSSTPNDYAMANIGQAKNVFSFDLHQFMPLWQKQQIVDADPNDAITSVDQVLPDDDFDGDGLSNMDEYQQQSDPTNYYSQGDQVVTPTIQIISGNNQTGALGAFLPLPLIVKVTDTLGNTLTNAPVIFTVSAGGGKLATINQNPSTLNATYRIITDITGQASLYYQMGATSSVANQINVTASTGSVTFIESPAASVPSGALLWLRADAGITQDTNGKVSQWADQSNGGNNAFQTSTDSQPTYVADGMNGKPTIRFDGDAAYLQLPSGFDDFTNGFTFVVVAKPTSNSNWERFIELGNGPNVNDILIGRDGWSDNLIYFAKDNVGLRADNCITRGVAQIFVVTHNIDGAWRIYKNGVLKASGNSPLPDNAVRTINYIGKSLWDGDSLYQGDISEIIIYNRNLSDFDRSQMTQSFGIKYSIAVDTDENGLSDSWEVQWFGGVGVDAAADPDGDGYSNAVECVHDTNPNSSNSTPIADFIVSHTHNTGYSTIQSALNAVNKDHQIIDVEPGVYAENSLYFPWYKVIIRSLGGAAVTIIDAQSQSGGPNVRTDAVIDGFTFTNGNAGWNGGGLFVTGGNVKLINCVIRDNESNSAGSAIYSYGTVTAINCTLLHNSANDGSAAIQTNNGFVTLLNTISWNGGNEIGVDDSTGSIGVTASYCDIQGDSVYPGNGNIKDNPLVRREGHLIVGSPCIDVGVAVRDAVLDMDNEARPSANGYDIGADEYHDTNGRGLPDWWQQTNFGQTGISPNEDPDGDDLSNLQEYAVGGDPHNFYSQGYEIIQPILEIISGNLQFGVPGEFAAQPLVVKITDRLTGLPINNATVSFTVSQGAGRIAVTNTGAPETHLTYEVRANSEGQAMLYYQFSSNASDFEQVTVSGGGDIPVIFNERGSGQGPDIVVDQSGITGVSSIQQALNAATDNQIIEVRPGTYKESYLTFPNVKITIRSSGGALVTIIDAQRQSGGPVISYDAIVNGFTLINGNAESNGGGICIFGGNVRLINCIIRDNVASIGGSAVYSCGATTVVNCSLFNNISKNSGAAIQTENGTVNLTNTIAWNGGNEIGLDVVTGLSTVTVNHSDIQGEIVYPGIGNINSDPLIWPDGHLFQGSPCRNAGAATDSPDRDMDNELRPIDGAYDIGADEYLDTNGYGLPNWWQLKYFGTLGVNAGSFSPAGNGLTNLQNYQQQIDPNNPMDSNGIPYAWEIQYFGGIRIDPYADPDGDGYSNGVEYAHNTDPTSASSVPTVDFVVSQLGGTGYTTIQSALDAVTSDYQIIDVEPGIYAENLYFQNKSVLIRSTQGATSTIIDGQKMTSVITVYADAIIDGFTLSNGYCDGFGGGAYIAAGKVRLVNCVMRNNECSNSGAAIYSYGTAVTVVNCTLINNYYGVGGASIATEGGSVAMVNTIVWNGGSEIGADLLTGRKNVTASFSNIRGASPYSGEGNINSDPLVQSDGHILIGSPCINAGMHISSITRDMDSEDRSTGGEHDIGADEFIATNGGDLPDWWKIKYFGQLNVDANEKSPGENGLTNWQSYLAETDPNSSTTTESNGLSMAWEFQYFGHTGIDPDADPDGDGYTNIYESTHNTDPTSATSIPQPDIIVDPSGDADFTNYADAISSLGEDYKIIQFNPGTYKTYVGSESSWSPELWTKVMLVSRDGASVTEFEGIGSSEVLGIHADATIDGFTIKNGNIRHGVLYYDCGGVHVYDSNVKLTNCIIRDHISEWSGSALRCSNGNLTVINCTLFNNSTNGEVSAIHVDDGKITLINSIVWNGGNEIEGNYSTGENGVRASYCDIQGDIVFPGQGNINVDPQLWKDGHLGYNSPCINSGTNVKIINRDVDAESRLSGVAYDMGVDEYVDTDTKGLVDWWQRRYFSQLGVDPLAFSPNGDGLTNLENYRERIDPINPVDVNGISYAWELQYFNQRNIDPNADPDGDGYSNIVEYLHNSDPTILSSFPAADMVVDGSMTTGYTTIQSALNAVTRDYQIIEVKPGVYRESNLTCPESYKIVLRSSGGALSTVIDGGSIADAILIRADAFINGISFINANGSGVCVVGGNVHLENCILRNNYSEWRGAALFCQNANLKVVHCTLFGNQTADDSGIIRTENGNIILFNSIIWDSGNEIGSDFNSGEVAVTASYCDVQGSSIYPGQGNINSDPMLLPDGHLSTGSPCIDAGGATGGSAHDMDMETRPAGLGYDIGADEYNGGLPEAWQMKYFGHLGVDPNALSPCGDGYTNYQNYLLRIDPINPIDSNGISYVWELEKFGQIHINPYVDSDLDGLNNLGEYLHGSDPFDSDTNGDKILDGVAAMAGLPVVESNNNTDSDHDGVIDSQDAFPYDPNKATGDPGDEAPPSIYLNQPFNAVLVQ